MRTLPLLLFAGSIVLGCGLPPRVQPNTSPDAAPRLELPDLEARVLNEVNRVRRGAGRSALRPDPELAAIARDHSRDMRDRRFVAHRNPDGLTPGERALRADYGFRHFGENLFGGRLYESRALAREGNRTYVTYRWHTPEGLATLVASMWMESPGHRENMLAGNFDYGGVGIAIGPESEVFVTLNLSAR